MSPADRISTSADLSASLKRPVRLPNRIPPFKLHITHPSEALEPSRLYLPQDQSLIWEVSPPWVRQEASPTLQKKLLSLNPALTPFVLGS